VIGSAAATVDLTALADDLVKAAASAQMSVMDVLLSMADDIAREMQREAPVDTGRLRDSIRVKNMGDHIVIGPEGVDYGVYVEYGTPPHDIRPRTGKALKFEINGKTVFASVVHHPGTKPNPFAERAAQNFLDRLTEKVADKGVKLILGDNSG